MIEMGVTIICSSASALKSFLESQMANYVTPHYIGLRSRCSELVKRSKFVSKASSDTQTCHRESEQSKTSPGIFKSNYEELDEHHRESSRLSGNFVKTEIGRGSPIPKIEKGVIRIDEKVEQSFV